MRTSTARHRGRVQQLNCVVIRSCSRPSYLSGGWELLAGGNTKLESKITYKTEDGLSDEEWSELSATSLNINLGSVEVNGELKPYRARVCTYPSDMIEWSNHSFYVENGEEWIVAADPVPVYE